VLHVFELGKQVPLEQAAGKEPVGDKTENAGKEQGNIKLRHDHPGLADVGYGVAVVQPGETVIVVDDGPHRSGEEDGGHDVGNERDGLQQQYQGKASEGDEAADCQVFVVAIHG